jgi:acetyl-CoA C-acetyltransferase
MNPVICSIARTPIGRFGDVYSPLSAVDLGAVAIRGALDPPARPQSRLVFR